jgi:hypothetical protein
MHRNILGFVRIDIAIDLFFQADQKKISQWQL